MWFWHVVYQINNNSSLTQRLLKTVNNSGSCLLFWVLVLCFRFVVSSLISESQLIHTPIFFFVVRRRIAKIKTGPRNHKQEPLFFRSSVCCVRRRFGSHITSAFPSYCAFCDSNEKSREWMSTHYNVPVSNYSLHLCHHRHNNMLKFNAKIGVEATANVTCEQALTAPGQQTTIHYVHTFLNNEGSFCLIFTAIIYCFIF